MKFAPILPLSFRNQNVGVTPVKVNTTATGVEVYGWRLINLNTGLVYLKLYDTVAAPTVGTTVPVAIIPIFASGVSEMELMSQNLNRYVPREFFQNNFWIACTTGIADTDTTAPSTGLDVQMKYLQ